MQYRYFSIALLINVLLSQTFISYVQKTNMGLNFNTQESERAYVALFIEGQEEGRAG